LLEVRCLLLELLQGIKATFFEAKLSIAYKASRAIPLGVWFVLEGWVEASAVIPMVTRFADRQEANLFALTTGFATLDSCVSDHLKVIVEMDVAFHCQYSPHQ
jgi:hypothetical protein